MIKFVSFGYVLAEYTSEYTLHNLNIIKLQIRKKTITPFNQGARQGPASLGWQSQTTFRPWQQLRDPFNFGRMQGMWMRHMSQNAAGDGEHDTMKESAITKGVAKGSQVTQRQQNSRQVKWNRHTHTHTHTSSSTPTHTVHLKKVIVNSYKQVNKKL